MQRMAARLTVAPVLETERLILRPHSVDDFAACVAMWRDPQVVRYTIGAESSPQRTWLRLLAYRGLWSLLGFGYWAVQSKSDGVYIGELGFADFHRNADPGVDGIPEIGWALATQVHGRGYATEALRAVIAWGDAYLSAARTVCIIHRDNAVSIKLAHKLGYRLDCAAAAHPEPHRVFTRDRKR